MGVGGNPYSMPRAGFWLGSSGGMDFVVRVLHHLLARSLQLPCVPSVAKIHQGGVTFACSHEFGLGARSKNGAFKASRRQRGLRQQRDARGYVVPLL